MPVFAKISGYKKISHCRSCNGRMINAKPSEIYCEPCIGRMKRALAAEQ
ncbi:hypothetical protein HYS47_03935 [Candidatus Woesearchaeota archaeon]|nr:hypothetical protein [Candidatus Woesearchaeota archaeon]